MRAPGIVHLTALLAALLGGTASGAAQVQGRPVALEVRGLFGDDLLLPDGYSPLLVEARNQTRRTLRGKVQVTVRHWDLPAVKHEVALDLPASASRRVTLDLFLPEGATVETRYLVDDRPLASATTSPAYAPSQRGLVVLSEPARLRGVLLDLEVEQVAGSAPYPGAVGTMVRMPVGVVPMDPATSDPILPTRSVGWATTALLIASAPDLARVAAAEQRALLDWVRSGGEVLIFPRTDGDLADPFLRALVGEVERFAGEPTVDQEALVPARARGSYFRGGDSDFRTESYGGSRRLGFGRVHLATYDGTAPPSVEAQETRTLVHSIASSRHSADVATPLLELGRRQDHMGEGWWGGGGPSFGSLRAALDPNEGYRPALGLVAIVLLLYVLVVGPVNFTFVGKRNRPTLALVTTPVAAFSCLVVMLGVGYLGKGTRMRYRAVEVVEVQEGDALGPARRYTGLFLTRPAVFDLEPPEGGVASVVRPSSADLAPVTDHGGEAPVLRRVRGRLWETVFVREERVVDLGGGVAFERADQRLVAVHNGTGQALKGAIVVDSAGAVYRVGDIPVGARVPVSQAAIMTLHEAGAFWGQEDPALRQLAEIMGLPSDYRPTLGGATRLVGGSFAAGAVPVLLAWSEVEPRGEIAGVFGREIDVRFLRVVPEVERQRVTPVLGADDWQGSTHPQPPEHLDEEALP